MQNIKKIKETKVRLHWSTSVFIGHLESKDAPDKNANNSETVKDRRLGLVSFENTTISLYRKY